MPARQSLHKLFIILFGLWSLVFGLWFTRFVFAEETKEPIIVNGDRVEYLYEERKVIGIKNVVITYKKSRLTCDKIALDMDTKEAIAEGNVVLTQKGSIFRGDKVHYNFTTEKGTIIKAEARGKPWCAKGQIASKVEDKDYIIERGYLSTCDLPYPHYRIQGRRIKIFVDNRVEAYHTVFFIGKCPVFYFPYYVHLLEDKRPRVTIVPGRNSTWGYYALTAWRYYLHEWARGYIHLDWREKKGLAEGIDYKYKMGYFGKGLMRFYYTHENRDSEDDIRTDPTSGKKLDPYDKRVFTVEDVARGKNLGRDRWRFQLRHKWEIDNDTTAMGEFHKLSDRLFMKDYFFIEEYEVETQPETYLSIIKTRPGYNLSLYLKPQTNDFFTVVERLPELTLDVKNQRLSDTDFYYRSTSSFVMLQKKFDNTVYNPKATPTFSPKQKANRFDTDHEFSYLTNLFKFLTFNPYIGIRETWYSEDSLENKNELRNIPILGTRLSTKFNRIFPVKTNIFGLDINSLRHIITPLINYKYNPTPNIKAVDLKDFDSIDDLGYENGFTFELVNRLQTKRGINKEVANLARFTTSTGVFSHSKISESDSRTIDDFMDDVKFDLELTPYPWLTIDVDSSYATKRNKEDGIETVNADIVAEKKDLWRLGLGYRYEQGYDGNNRIETSSSNSQIITDASYRLSPTWKLTAYLRYKKNSDRASFKVEEQNYSIEKDLHCWLAELNYQIKRTDSLEVENEYRLWLVMRLKAFPSLPIQMFKRTYAPPRAGVRTTSSE